MAGTYGVDVQLLHHLDVGYHTLYAYNVAVVGVELVAVDSLEEYGLAIDQYLLTLALHLAESHLLGYHLYYAVLVG